MSTAKPPSLEDTIASLIWRSSKHHIKLSRGLRLAYTPGSLNEEEPGQFRLCLSRAGGKRPSEEEDRIVYAALLAALRAQARSFDPPALRPNVAAGKTAVTLITWQEYKQERLL